MPEEDRTLLLRLPRGTVLKDGDLLRSQTGEIIKIAAKPEPVMTVVANNPLDLLRAAYHLGNRHVSLEIATTYLRLSRDRVLQTMLERLGLTVTEEVVPFQPEIGAYHQHGH
jgi:urease accessory protein